ncbi:LtfC-like domain-containing protein [Mycolicibacter arupensis]|jgi:hypothetical protein|uniref:LtfC/p132/Gp6 beta-sandwich domain-containing protein n=1 Tax=Mycolicibacter arupensis TaxID=342002 RepID=A0A0F5MVJ4_9MYCO|nr:hypothetical protein [Mycolicibacter arupensis]KKB98828.1 hypothetical protein WR43_12520 [Mycolicibacter arupensis]MCV7277100.1 hypothetical protein [Mycolicibacter arupensis]OQZ93672.1 hypothetical protein BST15_17520 [Mycolicibacter arupensis]TXI54433.1 MAG: hypothetical protein E6Q54_14615 [Mycolicibacter arupensis]
MLGSKTRQDTMVLALGQTWVASFFPPAGGMFPPGTTAECVISDPAGSVLAEWEPAIISEARIDFITAAAQCDPIPAGAYYLVTAHYPALGPRPPIDDHLSRGSVVRDDNPTPLAGALLTTAPALSFIDEMAGPAVDPNWVKVAGQGNLKIFDNSPWSLPNGMAGDSLLYTKAAARWRVQTNSDAAKAEFQVITSKINPGKTTVILSSNQAMTSWVGFQIHTATADWYPDANIVIGTSPTEYTVVETGDNSLSSNGRYTFLYDPLADEYLAYKESNFSHPLRRWVDEDHVIPHGNGYRFPAVLFESDYLTSGVMLSGWSVKDN